VYYDSKAHAISDCLALLKTNEDLGLSEQLRLVRKLSNKQFQLLFKRDKLARYLQ
jgi:hypothetical protein